MNNAVFSKLTNSKGFEITLCNLGASITSFLIPVSAQEKVDVVLGFDNVEDYIRSFQLEAQPFLGAVVGPHAGRVRNGKYIDQGKDIQLEKNCGDHHLHGGSLNLSNQLWAVCFESETTIVFEIRWNEGQTIYTTEYFLNDDTLYVNLQAVTEVDTLINLTQHSYFNLEGHQGDITNLEMKIVAAEFLEKDLDLLPTGRMLATENTSYDFSEFNPCPSDIDTSFVLKGKNPGAILRNKKNGLNLRVYTNQPSIHVYVGGNTQPIKGKNNIQYHEKSGICFEAQNFPDSPNHSNFKSGILRAGDTYINEIAFKFAIENVI